jgi:hypothetical protein
MLFCLKRFNMIFIIPVMKHFKVRLFLHECENRLHTGFRTYNVEKVSMPNCKLSYLHVITSNNIFMQASARGKFQCAAGLQGEYPRLPRSLINISLHIRQNNCTFAGYRLIT